MNYPTLEQYQEALHNPSIAFVDPELKQGTVKKSGLGRPLALCGGFALTYTVTVGKKQYAVRCFHKKNSSALEARYSAISARLKSLNSSYFLDFIFHPKWIRVDQKEYPLVKMAWASGETLGEFLESNYRNRTALAKLRNALQKLAAFLEQQRIAHGDIQTGNVMVSDGGDRVQLIDYDGMYVDEIRPLGSAELGHRNFQHPARTGSTNPYDATLDRFSFIALNLALRALEDNPGLWAKTRSDIDGVVFRAGDYMMPEASTTFSELSKHPSLGQDIKHFAAICKAPFNNVPTLADFLAGRKIPFSSISLSGTASGIKTLGYLSPYDVLDGRDFSHCLEYVGERVELIGKIHGVKDNGIDKFGKPFVFLNFGLWTEDGVKISIWSDGLRALAKAPDKNWKGKWISVVGLMNDPYRYDLHKCIHIGITVSQNNQITIIDEAEAEFRLAGSRKAPATSSPPTNNEVLKKMTTDSEAARKPAVTVSSSPPSQQLRSANEAVLDKMKQTLNAPAPRQPVSPPIQVRPAQSPVPYSPPKPPHHGSVHGSYNSPSHQPKRGLLGKVWDFFFS